MLDIKKGILYLDLAFRVSGRFNTWVNCRVFSGHEVSTFGESESCNQTRAQSRKKRISSPWRNRARGHL